MQVEKKKNNELKRKIEKQMLKDKTKSYELKIDGQNEIKNEQKKNDNNRIIKPIQH